MSPGPILQSPKDEENFLSSGKRIKMKQLITLLVFASFFNSSFALAAKHKSSKSSKKASAKVAEENKKWNEICQDLLDTSVKSTIKLEKSVRGKKKVSKKDVEDKIQNELMVVQLNAWVCAISNTKEQKGASAEHMFLQDYSKLVKNCKRFLYLIKTWAHADSGNQTKAPL